MTDLKRRDLISNCKKAVWREFVEDEAAKLNCFLEEDEGRKKDELKQRENEMALYCNHSPPHYVVQSPTVILICRTIQRGSGKPHQAETWCCGLGTSPLPSLQCPIPKNKDYTTTSMSQLSLLGKFHFTTLEKSYMYYLATSTGSDM